MNELNDALLWLAERRGRISFSVDDGDRVKGLDSLTPTVAVEAMNRTPEEVEDGCEPEPCFGSAKIQAGNVVAALVAAINSARSDDRGADEMVDEGDPNTD